LLAADVGRLMAVVTHGTTADDALIAALMLGFALVGAAALHPHSTQAVDRVLDPIHQMPRTQVGVLVAAVLLGPVIVGLRLDESGTRSLVLTLSGTLSILVVVHLVRLVQGRAALEHRAHHDELTGLANRTLFGDRVAVAIAHARRAGTHSAVLFLDLDRFKNVNDSLGHSVGNLLLQAVAKRLRGATRAEDTVARLGGDEFVVFLPQVAHPEEAATVAANILDEFEQPFALSGHRLFASPSIGIAVFPQDGQDADALLKNADTAMYRAKARGRRTFCAYDRSMNDHAHERLALEGRLHTAIERGELRLYYQPKVHLASGQMTGMEALLRWEHPELGLLEPAEFISLAEDSGLIVPVGEWALHEACRQNQAWADAGLPPLVVAVNLSLRQFQQQQIEDVTARILRATRLDPALLELEVTESLATQDTDAVRATLLDLREMGVRCSIDDFGTGYSGLSQLMQFPIDKLKIDKSFVATIDGDREAPIVVAVVALARGLGLEVIAEGVETAEQLERLRELGCDEMQGYLFSRPLPPERFEELLRELPVAGTRLFPPQPGRLRVVPAVG
jgi:diguanylate cyclase (GGDEF)-like protein